MVAAMSAAEREEHEDRALKLRKAMGENLGDDVEGEDVSARERRLNLIRCEPVKHASAVTDVLCAVLFVAASLLMVRMLPHALASQDSGHANVPSRQSPIAFSVQGLSRQQCLLAVHSNT